ncbi:MAG: hypothetical protein IT270_00950 [Saprospiraceae bacterium]|nr:hypothetical protein [Saprospiraceae bacterium]
MKIKALLPVFALLVVFGMIAPGCLRDKCTSDQTFVRFEPIYLSEAEMRSDLSVEAPHTLQNTGKIYAYGNYLFINEQKEGIHIIDNSNPAEPQPLAFWRIKGNVDVAIRGNILYADQYIDLLSIDLSAIQQPQQVCRQKKVFGLLGYDVYRGYLVDYKRTEETMELECTDNRVGLGWFMEGDVVFTSNESSGGGASLPTGVGGSYARFGLVDQYLYTLDHNSMKTWSVANPSCPSQLDSVYVGWDIETLFPWKNRLFIGSQTGVYIFNNQNPQRPVYETTFWHATGCDPVVCDDKYAYVTVHDDTPCNGNSNVLLVVGIEYLPATAELAQYDMKQPKGLSVRGDKLYLCDDGLKIYDKSNPQDMKLLAHLKGLDTYDVISLDADHLILTGPGYLAQYDVSDPANPREISRL